MTSWHPPVRFGASPRCEILRRRPAYSRPTTESSVSGLVGVSSVIVFVGVVATTVISLLLSLAFIKALSTQGRLLRNGERAQARILEAEPLPPSKYGDRARFTLEIHRLDGRVYQGSCTYRVHALHAHRLQVGCLVDVRVDHGRPELLMITGPSEESAARQSVSLTSSASSASSVSSASSPSQQRSPQKPRLLRAAAPSAQSLRKEWPPTP